MGSGLGWFVGPKFLLCYGLGWVEEIGPTDNSALGVAGAAAAAAVVVVVVVVSKGKTVQGVKCPAPLATYR